MPQPDLFENVFHAWLEANGVKFDESMTAPPFHCTIDLNALKLGFIELLAFEQLRTTHDLLHDPALVPGGACDFCDEERGATTDAGEQPQEA